MKDVTSAVFAPGSGGYQYSSITFKFISAVIDTLNEWRRRQRTRRQLAALNSHMLRDIGISSEQQFVESNKPFWEA